MVLKPGGYSPYTYCGSRLWVDHTRDAPLANKLFQYWGTTDVGGVTYHRFAPYKRPGAGMLLTDDQILLNVKVFKPLVLDCEKLGFGKVSPYAP